MAALEEFELGIDHIRNAFKRADNGFTNAYKMLEAQQQKNHKLEAENAKLRELVREIWRSCPVDEDDCAKCPHHIEESDEVWCDIPILMEELGVEIDR